MKWYKRDPAAALEGMLGLSGEERGYYNTLLDLLYARAPHGSVTDELVIKAAGERPQVWRRVKASLIAKGKVRETDGKLTANRVETELVSAAKRIGLMTGLRQRQLEKQQDSSGASARTTTTTSTTREVERAKALSPSRRKPRTALPPDWKPEDLGFGEQSEFDKFCDHAKANGRICADWPAAWRNWKRRAPEFTRGSWKDDRQKENYDVSRTLREYISAGADEPRKGGDADDAPPWRLPLAKPA